MSGVTKDSLCHFKGCKEVIQLDHSIESSSVGRAFGLVVVGYCEFHKKVQAKQRELFSKMDKTKHHSEIANKLWKENRKKFNQVQKEAIRLVRLEV